MSNTFVPFNFAPKAIEVLTSGQSYALASTEFAMLVITAYTTYAQGEVSVGSDIVFRSGYKQSATVNSAAGVGTVVYPGLLDAEGFVTVGANDNSGSSITFSGLNGIVYAGNQQVAVRRTGETSVGQYTVIREKHSDNPLWIWAPAGQTISVNGGAHGVRVVVHRYDLPS